MKKRLLVCLLLLTLLAAVSCTEKKPDPKETLPSETVQDTGTAAETQEKEMTEEEKSAQKAAQERYFPVTRLEVSGKTYDSIDLTLVVENDTEDGATHEELYTFIMKNGEWIRVK